MEKSRKKGQNGKGSGRRPLSVTRKEFEENWDKLFKNSKKKKK